MKNIFFLLAVLLCASTSANSQAQREKPYGPVETVDLTNCRLDCFSRGWANFNDADTFLLNLRKGQKIEISIGWRELPEGTTDPLGRADLLHHGFTIFDPAGRVLNIPNNRFVITAKTGGTFKIVVKPHYRAIRKLAPGVKPADYDYRLDMTLDPAN